MTRGVAFTAVALAAMACGGSSSGGGGSTGTSVSVGSGPYQGTYSNAAALSASGSCTEQNIPLTGAAISVLVTSASTDVCQALSQGREPASSTTLFLTIAKLNIAGQPQAITPGTYPVFDTSGTAVPTPDTTGTASVAVVSAAKTGTSAGPGQGCTQVSSEDAASGSVTVSTVTAGRVSGTLNVSLKNAGGVVTGAFDAPLCAGAYSLSSSCEISGVPSRTSCQ